MEERTGNNFNYIESYNERSDSPPLPEVIITPPSSDDFSSEESEELQARTTTETAIYDDIWEPQDIPGDQNAQNTEEELKNLSEFTTDIRYSEVDDAYKFLTITEFNSLPNTGRINPCKLRAAQGGINSTFRDGRTFEEMEASLIRDEDYTRDIPPVEIGIHDGKVFSFDTRRLLIHMKAWERNENVYILYKKISGGRLQERIEEIYDSRPWNGAVIAQRYGGKRSASEPFINPALRKQLSEKVDKGFMRYPKDRESGDINGFPIKQEKAKKIYIFLLEKKKHGSKFAEAILGETKRIFTSKGAIASWDFLINIKKDCQSNSSPFFTQAKPHTHSKKEAKLLSQLVSYFTQRLPLISFSGVNQGNRNFFGLKPYSVNYAVGNCLFEAIAAAIAGENGKRIRDLAINHIRGDEHLKYYINRLTDPLQTKEGNKNFTSINEYIKLMSQDQTWGTAIEIIALARALQRPIVILTPSNAYDEIVEEDEYAQNEPIFLNYVNRNHYEPLFVPDYQEARAILRAIRANQEVKARIREARTVIRPKK